MIEKTVDEGVVTLTMSIEEHDALMQWLTTAYYEGEDDPAIVAIVRGNQLTRY